MFHSRKQRSRTLSSLAEHFKQMFLQLITVILNYLSPVYKLNLEGPWGNGLVGFDGVLLQYKILRYIYRPTVCCRVVGRFVL